MQTLPVQCGSCGFTWECELGQASIELANGNTITFAPGAIQTTCPSCGARGVNDKTSSGAVTAKGIRGLLAVLRTVPASPADYEQLIALIVKAQLSGAKPIQVAEQINTSIPQLKPVGKWVLSQESGTAAAWIAALVAVLTLILGMIDKSPAPPPTPAPSIVIQQCAPGYAQEFQNLLKQISREIGSSSKRSSERSLSPISDEGSP